MLGEIHVALLKLIIKDIEDVARTPSSGLGVSQNGAANPSGGHPEIVEGVTSALCTSQKCYLFGIQTFLILAEHFLMRFFLFQAYTWGFDIRNWQRHLNPLTWPEIFRQLALSAGFGPRLKKRSTAWSYLPDNDEVCTSLCLFTFVTINSGMCVLSNKKHKSGRCPTMIAYEPFSCRSKLTDALS